MTAHAHTRPGLEAVHTDRLREPGYQAYLLLRTVFVIAPIARFQPAFVEMSAQPSRREQLR